MKKFILIVALCAVSGFVLAANVVTVFHQRHPIVLGNTNSVIITFEYDRDEMLTNFPVLIALDTSITGFSYNAFIDSTNGYDLRFWDEDAATELNYEFDVWNTSGTSYIWVRIPRLDSGSHIWASWADPLKTNRQSYTTNGSTWSPDHVGVWHLNETNGDTTVSDSTSNSFDGTLVGNPTFESGFIGNGIRFDGDGDYYYLPSITNNGEFAEDKATLMLFIKTDLDHPSETSASNGFCTLGYSGGNFSHYPYWSPGGGSLFYMNVWRNGDTSKRVGNIVPDASIVRTNWHIVTITSDDDIDCWTMYQNDVALSNITGQIYFNATTLNITNTPYIGKSDYDNPSYTYYVQGMMDEVRIRNTGVSSNWIWASWMSMQDRTNFTHYGKVGE